MIYFKHNGIKLAWIGIFYTSIHIKVTISIYHHVRIPRQYCKHMENKKYLIFPTDAKVVMGSITDHMIFNLCDIFMSLLYLLFKCKQIQKIKVGHWQTKIILKCFLRNWCWIFICIFIVKMAPLIFSSLNFYINQTEVIKIWSIGIFWGNPRN